MAKVVKPRSRKSATGFVNLIAPGLVVAFFGVVPLALRDGVSPWVVGVCTVMMLYAVFRMVRG